MRPRIAARSDMTSGEPITSPVSDARTAEFVDWLDRGREFDVVEVHLGADVSVWFEGDEIFWERQSDWSSNESATAVASATESDGRPTKLDADAP